MSHLMSQEEIDELHPLMCGLMEYLKIQQVPVEKAITLLGISAVYLLEEHVGVKGKASFLKWIEGVVSENEKDEM